MEIGSFATLRNAKIILRSSKSEYFAVEPHFFQNCMRSLLQQIPVDDAWYLTRYPDVAEAIKDQLVSGAADHYVRHGYFENRLPFRIKVNERWYLEQYPDVRDAIAKGHYKAAQDHFEDVGYAEGRLPYANFILTKQEETKQADAQKIVALRKS